MGIMGSSDCMPPSRMVCAMLPFLLMLLVSLRLARTPNRVLVENFLRTLPEYQNEKRDSKIATSLIAY